MLYRRPTTYLLMSEMILFSWYYFSGMHGYTAYRKLSSQKDAILCATQEALTESESLAEQIHTMKTSSYYNEQVAREQLHMAYPDEIIFVTKST